LNFLLLGLALVLVDMPSRSCRKTSELLTITSLVISLLALIGYVCNVPSFYGRRSIFPGTGMALPTMVTFLALGFGLLCAHPTHGLMEILTSKTTAGVVARRLILAPVLIPLA